MDRENSQTWSVGCSDGRQNWSAGGYRWSSRNEETR